MDEVTRGEGGGGQGTQGTRRRSLKTVVELQGNARIRQMAGTDVV